MKRKFNLNIGCIIKILLILALIMGIFFVFLNCSGGSCIKKIDKTIPDIKTVPWVVTTPTHIYYAKGVLKTASDVEISDWYEQLKGKWVYHKDSILLEYKIYGKITTELR